MATTPKDEALRAAREARMRDAQLRETHPWMARFDAFDAAGRKVVHAIPALVAWCALLAIAPDTMTAMAIAAFAGAAQFFYRAEVYAAVGWISRTCWRLSQNALAAKRDDERKAAQAAAITDAAARREAEREREAIDGIPFDTIARAIGDAGDASIQKTLESINLSSKRANRVRQTLLNARFLVWPTTITDTTYALGDEQLAIKDGARDNTTVLHPTLLTVPPDERAQVIANALRRTEGITPRDEPKIRGELSPRGVPLLGHGRHVRTIEELPISRSTRAPQKRAIEVQTA